MVDNNMPNRLLSKLLEVRKEISYLQSDAKVSYKGVNFSYVSESSIMASIRPKLDELGIWFEQSLSEIHPLKEEGSPRPYSYLVRLKYYFKDVETGEEFERWQALMTNETTPQAFGSLMTYGMRYFLYRFFIIPMDDLDPDQIEMKIQKTKKGSDNTITKKQYVELEKLLKGQKELYDQTMTFACGNGWDKKGLGLSDIPAPKYHMIIDRIKSKVEGGKADAKSGARSGKS